MQMALTLESPAAAAAGGAGDDDKTYGMSSKKRERMFEKVVTPSDVGKLNRLVVPKHFAERHLPLRGAAARSRGTVLCFHDLRGGGGSPAPAVWRFRYSFWSSSQSYVMTKGWSRYVRDKRLAAGDTVTFCRDSATLFIDCHRRRGRTTRSAMEHHQNQIQGAVVPAAMLTAVVPPTLTALGHHHHQQQQQQVAFPGKHQQAAASAAAEEEEARRQHGRWLRLFGVNLLELRAEPLPLDLQL